jgi:SlyX protein
MSDSALEKIELKIAFLENAYQELSDVVYRQQREIEALQFQLTISQRQLDEMKAEQATPRPEDERPPHY